MVPRAVFEGGIELNACSDAIAHCGPDKKLVSQR